MGIVYMTRATQSEVSWFAIPGFISRFPKQDNTIIAIHAGFIMFREHSRCQDTSNDVQASNFLYFLAMQY